MNALTLLLIFLIYTLLFLVFLLAYLLGWIDFENHKIFKSILSTFLWITAKVVPKCALELFRNVSNYILYKRNPAIQLLYATLLFAGYASYTTTAFPFVSESFMGKTPFYLLAVNLCLFAACCCCDPGVIAKENHEKYAKDYDYDGVMYLPRDCSTCLLKKPARSKHCAVCDVCIARFDHHCSWVNSCIGKYNHKYFIGFLLSLVLMCGVSSFMIIMVFIHLVDAGNLHLVQYTDRNGNVYDASFGTVLQYLVSSYPLMAFLLIFLVSLFIVLGCFLSFHVYLALTNQTTNEVFGKKHSRSSRTSHMKVKNDKKSSRKYPKQMENHRRSCKFFGWYSKGIFGNISEILFPL